MTPGEVLRSARARADWTQERLAHEMARRMDGGKVNAENIRQQLSKIESGRRGVGETWAQLLASIPELGLTADELLQERANLTTILARLSAQAELIQRLELALGSLLEDVTEGLDRLERIETCVCAPRAPASRPRSART